MFAVFDATGGTPAEKRLFKLAGKITDIENKINETQYNNDLSATEKAALIDKLNKSLTIRKNQLREHIKTTQVLANDNKESRNPKCTLL